MWYFNNPLGNYLERNWSSVSLVSLQDKGKGQQAHKYTSAPSFMNTTSSLFGSPCSLPTTTTSTTKKKHNLVWTQWSCMMQPESSGEPLQTSSTSGERAREREERAKWETNADNSENWNWEWMFCILLSIHPAKLKHLKLHSLLQLNDEQSADSKKRCCICSVLIRCLGNLWSCIQKEL